MLQYGTLGILDFLHGTDKYYLITWQSVKDTGNNY